MTSASEHLKIRIGEYPSGKFRGVDLVHVPDYIETMTIVNVHEAKTNFSRLLERAHIGEEIILAKAGVPWARLLPLKEPAQRIPGRYHEKTDPSFFEKLPEEELKGWEA